MPHAIRVHQYGGPEVMLWEPFESRVPGPGEVLVRHTAIGLNFIDVYERTGLYPGRCRRASGTKPRAWSKPSGRACATFKVGRPRGVRVERAGRLRRRGRRRGDRLVPIPDDVSDRLAAAALLKGMTAQVLLRRTYRVRKGTVVVVHAAAGGVGSILVQWARHLGAQVIGVVGSEAQGRRGPRARLPRRAGAGRDDLAGARPGTDAAGEARTWSTTPSARTRSSHRSTACARSGSWSPTATPPDPVPPIAPLELARRGSLYLTRPTLFSYVAQRADLLRSATELFDVIGRGVVRIEIGQTYALRDVQRAHRDLQERRTVGSTVLLP